MKTIKAIVPNGSAGLMKALVLTMFFVGLLFLNSCANLIDAAGKGDTARVNALLNKGADVNAKDKAGWTVLMLASDKGHTEIVKALIDKGADVNATYNGKTALMYASDKGHTEIVNVLRQEEEKRKQIADFKKAFDKALNKNTVTAYKKFIEKYPKGKLSDEVKIKIEKLEFLHKQHVAAWKKKSCKEVIAEWTTNDIDIIAAAMGMDRDTAKEMGIGRKGTTTVVPPDDCSLLMQGDKVTPYCNGQPLTSSCTSP